MANRAGSRMGVATGASVMHYGDASILVTLGDRIDASLNSVVLAIAERILQLRERQPGWGPVVTAYASLVVHVDVLSLALEDAREVVEEVVAAELSRVSTTVGGEQSAYTEIPVLYGGLDGPDLEKVAELIEMPTESVVSLHARREYRVFMLGFAPGFAYLGTLPPELVVPRLPTPRVQVPGGSVGIGGWQTAVYPMSSPGGLRIIGRTDVKLWDVDSDPPARLRPGTRVRFVPRNL